MKLLDLVTSSNLATVGTLTVAAVAITFVALLLCRIGREQRTEVPHRGAEEKKSW